MSTERKHRTEPADAGLGDDDVAGYLKANRDYFERHPGLLAHLRLPHQVGSNAVSLIERQVAILREKNRKLDGKLRELLGVARANDMLSGKIHKLSLKLIGSHDTGSIMELIERTLRQDLGADQAVLLLFADGPVKADLLAGAYTRRIDRKEPGLELFHSFLKTSRPRCGQVKGAKREFLFGRDATDIQSAALIPLGKKAEVGFIAIGSHDAARFHPGMSTDFLVRLGELIERGLRSTVD